MAPPREPVYAKDEKALCFHHEFLYEAKVLDSRPSDPSDKKSPLQYRVHYKGWKSTWDDWVPQDRLRKLTEENKQLATNLKREIDEMNPRTAAKSSKSAKKKTAGSDLSSGRGSEERQSLPPGRSLKRGRDNEIEKVGSSISSHSSSSKQSARNTKALKESPRIWKAGGSVSLPHCDNSDVNVGLPALQLHLEPSLLSTLAVEFIRGAEDIDVDFWAKEAILLDIGSERGAAAERPVYLEKLRSGTSHAVVEKTQHGKRLSLEKSMPLDQLSESALMAKVFRMLRDKAETIGAGPDPPWPNGPPKGPQRHPKWSNTMRVDSHNHAKLGFYADAKPTDNPVIAGYAPESPPIDIVLKSEAFHPLNKKRKSKTARPPESLTWEKADSKGRRIESCSTTDDSQQSSYLEQDRSIPDMRAPADPLKVQDALHSEIQASEDVRVPIMRPLADLFGAQDSLPNGSQGFEDFLISKSFSQGLQMLEQRLGTEDSEDETNIDYKQEEHFHARPAVKIEIPDHLKAILVDDWENVTKNLSLVPIPADHPVSEILSTYFEEEKGKRRLGSAEADLLEEVVQGVRDYFEQCLGKLLLYRFEREQYFRLHQAMEAGKDEFEGRPLKDKKIADIYGAEHLCRLFVSLPELIAQTNMDAQSVSKLRQEIQALTAWLGKNSTRFFTAEYETAPQEYVEKARGL